MAQVKVVADSLDQCVDMGDLHHAIGSGRMTRDAVHAELGQLIVGARPGRARADEIYLFDSTGVGVQDVAAASMIYDRARDRDAGLSLRLA
jgi:ornithine cyclodeaminase/alanine dehydrogenase-like protein (mu-crystallin family)